MAWQPYYGVVPPVPPVGLVVTALVRVEVIWLNARLISFANPCIVLTAAKTTNAMIKAYSTKP